MDKGGVLQGLATQNKSSRARAEDWVRVTGNLNTRITRESHGNRDCCGELRRRKTKITAIEKRK